MKVFKFAFGAFCQLIFKCDIRCSICENISLEVTDTSYNSAKSINHRNFCVNKKKKVQ